MTDDLIRKSDVLETYAELYDIFDDNKAIQEELHKVFDKINDIPTIEPKRGKWIFKTVFPNDKSEFPMGYLVCSVCGSHQSNSTPCNYCDNCGARMKGADDADE